MGVVSWWPGDQRNVLDAYESRSQCETAGRSYVADMEAKGRKDPVYQCLPDSVDPRGPKPK